jgi:glycosyltransferase involved in cell wall biosynthesis
MAIPYLSDLGWRPTVLAVAPEFVQAPADEWLLQTLPDDLEVHRVSALPVALTRRVGMSTLAFRCRRAMRHAGDRLLASRRFDLIYFSTTQVGVHRLGLRWKQKFGVPFVLDLQDPWVNDYYRRNPGVRPPGGRVKFAISQLAARRDEPRCLQAASAVTTVSARYIDDIAERISSIDRSKFHVLPFGASERDYEIAGLRPVSQAHINFQDGFEHWVAVGRGGDDMRTSLRALFGGFRKALEIDPIRFGRVRMHFLGTDYAVGERARETVRPIAIEEGVGEYVFERPHRIPYSEALQCIVKADVLLVIGSNDPGYNPSKVAPYLFSGRPVLAILHDSSPAATVVEAAGGACVRFDERSDDLPASMAKSLQQLADQAPAKTAELNELSAETMARRLTAIFDSARMD